MLPSRDIGRPDRKRSCAHRSWHSCRPWWTDGRDEHARDASQGRRCLFGQSVARPSSTQLRAQIDQTERTASAVASLSGEDGQVVEPRDAMLAVDLRDPVRRKPDCGEILARGAAIVSSSNRFIPGGERAGLAAAVRDIDARPFDHLARSCAKPRCASGTGAPPRFADRAHQFLGHVLDDRASAPSSSMRMAAASFRPRHPQFERESPSNRKWPFGHLVPAAAFAAPDRRGCNPSC